MDILKNVNTFALNLNKIIMGDLNRLKVVLIEQKKTGKWLAEQLGVSTTTTSRWCSNASQPDLQTLNKIAKVLNVLPYSSFITFTRSNFFNFFILSSLNIPIL